ncbi:hypothetical protein SLEP1_g23921 [Rubroshorea leprosula]|uniref:DUF4220 domain-containing protein n=1 Tax=Rubroshorea leprosula TaxID=152421 RepID=A0AAV5JPX2_9ROSI|nr:hypothetical protein SLEP1_g23921 [Rubroshorea leprosula]
MNDFFKTILWFAYIGADWIAIVTLGKLSGSHVESTATNVLRAYWAPLLLVHLGGPDTITACTFEDNKLWIRHLISLLVKVFFVIYVICMSWTFSWLSFFTLPLILAGIIKYVEKILCLKLSNSQKTKPLISNMFNLQSHSDLNENQTLDRLQKENPTVLSAYLFFTIMRPDVNDYLSSENLSDVGTRIKAYLRETTGIDGRRAFQFADKYLALSLGKDVFEIIFIQLGFMFDAAYTKASLIHTKLGCFLRLASSTSFFSVLLLFFIDIIKKPKFHGSRIDIAITGFLLSGAIAQEFYATWVIHSSDWAVLVAEFHHNVLVRKVFKITSKYFPRLLRQSRRWSNQMGQFDLLAYCWRCKKRKANQSHGFLPKITIGNEIAEMWHKYCIIIWHLATIVCYLQEDNHDGENMEISKCASDYMMYLLAMCPALLLSGYGESFWLVHAYDNLKGLLPPAIDIRNAASKLFSNPDNAHEEELESREITFENLKGEVLKLVTILKQLDNKWEMLRDVWIEMLLYAAVSSRYINHVKLLGEGIELFSLIWLLAGTSVLSSVFQME